MGLINNMGNGGLVTYGTNANLRFTLRFPSPTMTSEGVINTQAPTQNTNKPVAGTITVAGVTVTLTASDVLSVAGIAAKIKATSISGYTTILNEKDPSSIILQSTTVGSVTRPTVVLGTARNILFEGIEFTNGVLCASGNLDDIYVGGKVPFTMTLMTTSATATVSTSGGSLQEQRAGALTYGAAVTFTNNVYTVTTPVNFVRVSTSGITAPSQVKLTISR